jgi:osmotically-inducible protein OsmY
MRTLLAILCVTGICAGAGWARDASTPDRFQSDTRPKSDELLATAVHDSLAKDARVNSMQVRVSAREGIVQLSGTVPREGDRDAAESIARQVAGVRDVTNKIVVSANPARPGDSPIPERPRP